MSYRYNPFTGQMDYYEGGGSADDATRIEVTRLANGSGIAKYSPVALLTADEVITADTATSDSATVFGLALNDALAGESVRILIFGIVTDPSFAFPLNAPLFNSSAGPISLVATTIVGEYFCSVGKSNGAGSVLIDPSKPTEVT